MSWVLFSLLACWAKHFIGSPGVIHSIAPVVYIKGLACNLGSFGSTTQSKAIQRWALVA